MYDQLAIGILQALTVVTVIIVVLGIPLADVMLKK